MIYRRNEIKMYKYSIVGSNIIYDRSLARKKTEQTKRLPKVNIVHAIHIPGNWKLEIQIQIPVAHIRLATVGGIVFGR